MDNDNPAKTLLMEWYRRVVLSQQSHFNAASHFKKFNYWLGVPVVVLSAIVGTSVFTTLETTTITSNSIKITLGLTSVLAAVLASLQTFLRYAEQSEKHRIAGSRYGTLRRKIEQLLISIPEEDQELKKVLNELREDQDLIGSDAPDVPNRIYECTKQRYKERFKDISFLKDT